MSPGRLPAGLLVDLDGTLVDTECLWQVAQKRIVENMGGVWSSQLNEELIGGELVWNAQRMIEHSRAERDARQLGEELVNDMVELVQGGDADVRPGARQLLRLARKLEIPVAVVTSSYRRLAQASLGAFENNPFSVIVAGDEVSSAKPHPEPYLRAAELLGVPIGDCVAFEDSPAGIQSALSSGAVTVAVPNHAEILPMPGVTIIESLALVDPGWLRRLMQTAA